MTNVSQQCRMITEVETARRGIRGFMGTFTVQYLCKSKKVLFLSKKENLLRLNQDKKMFVLNAYLSVQDK